MEYLLIIIMNDFFKSFQQDSEIFFIKIGSNPMQSEC